MIQNGIAEHKHMFSFNEGCSSNRGPFTPRSTLRFNSNLLDDTEILTVIFGSLFLARNALRAPLCYPCCTSPELAALSHLPLHPGSKVTTAMSRRNTGVLPLLEAWG